MIVFMYIRQREPAKIVSNEWKLTIVFLRGLNVVSPEGNGRSTRELIRCMALEYSLHINWGNTDRETLIDSAIAAVDDDMAFCDVLKQCIESPN